MGGIGGLGPILPGRLAIPLGFFQCTDLFVSVVLKGEIGIGSQTIEIVLNGMKEARDHLARGTETSAPLLRPLC